MRAAASLMTATGGPPAPSRVSKDRPLSTGMPIARKYSVVATRASMEGCWAIGRGGRPFTSKVKLKRKPPRGTPMMAPAVRTPGSAASLGMSRSWKAARAASSL